MGKYEDLIPFLKKEYNEVKTNEDLNEEIELTEDKIPVPLYKAYIRDNDQADSILSTYGDNEQQPNHRHIGILKDGDYRKLARWDFGKAHYNKLTKQQAADLLGMRIYSGKGRNKTEISINDDVPETVSIELEGNLAKENINKLRFLVKLGSNWTLTEFEYRGQNTVGDEVNEFFPIFRGMVPSDRFEAINAKLKKDDNNIRINDVRGWKTEKAVYYMIKVSDLIFETDEYDFPLQLNYQIADIGGLVSDTQRKQKNIEMFFKLCLIPQVMIDYLNLLKDNFDKSLDIKKIIEDSKTVFSTNGGNTYSNLNDIMFYLVDENKTLTPQTDPQTFISIVDDAIAPTTNQIISNNWNSVNLVAYADSCMNYLLTQVGNETKEWFNANLKKPMDSDVDNLKNYNIDDVVFTYEDIVLNKIDDENSKKVWTKRVHNSRLHTQRTFNTHDGAVIQRGNPNFTPYDRYDNNNRKMQFPDVADSGIHKKSINDIGIFDNTVDNGLLNRYVELLRDKKSFKRNYINALNYYNQIKKEAAYFDNDEDYEDQLESAKRQLINCKATYMGGKTANGDDIKGALGEIKDIKSKLVLAYDKDMSKTNTLVTNHTNYLQKNYKKLLDFTNLINDISHYTEEDIKKIYGFENKEELEALEKVLADTIEKQKSNITKIETTKNKIKELEEQLKQLTVELSDSEQDLNNNIKEIAELNTQKVNLSSSIDKSILKSYQDQDLFNSFVQKLDDNIEKTKSTIRPTQKDKGNKKPAELDQRFLQLVKEFSNTPKKPEEEPDEDDILLDDEENNQKQANV